ncbi:MAG: DUF3524 domain-containing protein [Desulfosalsimonas sp.]|uniref:tRNA-queuosine alpha-mannosyltransferase domain-containing protein n=1 Tax=Desulfosalsimonas sp. TaxID=3073848 RepID=UPI003971077A
MKLLFLEPFYGGSHRDFADGLCRHSRHVIDLRTMPERFWKWRMRGAALHFIRRISDPGAYDAMICPALMSLADFRMLCRGRCPPAIVYFHENQLTYPVAPGESRDLHFAFTDITTALAADRALFNSRTHLTDFFHHVPELLNRMPDFRPSWVVDQIRAKSGVCYPGCRFPADPPDSHALQTAGQDPPLVIWNHRWEFDKQPEMFFAALEQVAQTGVDFEVAVLGRAYEKTPWVFAAARSRLGGRIRQFGHVEDKGRYLQWLARGTVVVSTAIQENFGISVVEAARFGCLPLVPNRLVYPEIIPADLHRLCLYDSFEGLVEKLGDMLCRPRAYDDQRRALAAHMRRYSWEHRIGEFDREFEELAAGSRG